jgi:hypothetical protein
MRSKLFGALPTTIACWDTKGDGDREKDGDGVGDENGERDGDVERMKK